MPRYDTPIRITRTSPTAGVVIWDRWGDITDNSAALLSTRDAVNVNFASLAVDIETPYFAALIDVPPGQLRITAAGRMFDCDEVLFSGERRRFITLRCTERLEDQSSG